MVIRDGMVYAAGCNLPPLTKERQCEHRSRHAPPHCAAAIGMSENSDAVVVVVSEETGQISIACNGVLTRNYTRDTLEISARRLPPHRGGGAAAAPDPFAQEGEEA